MVSATIWHIRNTLTMNTKFINLLTCWLRQTNKGIMHLVEFILFCPLKHNIKRKTLSLLNKQVSLINSKNYSNTFLICIVLSIILHPTEDNNLRIGQNTFASLEGGFSQHVKRKSPWLDTGWHKCIHIFF